MITRRRTLGLVAGLPFLGHAARAADLAVEDIPPAAFSEFSKRLRPIGRVLEIPDTYVWCNAPIEDDRGRTHLFFSHWEKRRGMGGWINASVISHAVADRPEGPYPVVGPVLEPRGPTTV